MRSIITLMAMMLILLTSACRGDERPKRLVYGYVTHSSWPVIYLSRFWNSHVGDSRLLGAQFSNYGWDKAEGNATATAIYFQEDGLKNTLRFDVTWYEIFSDRFYKARIEVDARDLHHDWIRKDAGQIVLRIGRNGEVQAVSAQTEIDPTKTEITVLNTVCGKIFTPTDPFIIAEIKRLTSEPELMTAANSWADHTPPPTHCE